MKNQEDLMIDGRKVSNALKNIGGDVSDIGIERLKEEILTLNYEEKIELFSNILCNEWYTVDHFNFIKSALYILTKSAMR